MRVRSIVVVALAAATLAGCGGGSDDPSPTPTSTPTVTSTPSPSQEAASPAVRRLRTALDQASSWKGVRIDGQSRVQGRKGQVRSEADLDSGAWRAEVQTGDIRFTVRSRFNTTWVKADEAFWTSSGYTQDSARKADGRWVLMDQSGGDRLREQLSPERLLDRARTAAAKSLGKARRVVRDGTRTWEIAAGDQAGTTFQVTSTGPARLLAVGLAAQGTTARFDIEQVSGRVTVEPPPADEVVKP